MESNEEVKEIIIKNRTCYFFSGLIKLKILILIIFYLMKNHTKLL